MSVGNLCVGDLKSVQFKVLSPEHVVSMSVAHIQNEDSVEGASRIGTLTDLRMGPRDKGERCQTCKGDIRSCCGHFGHMELPSAIFHPGLLEDCVDILKCVCFFCSRVLLDRKDPRYRKISQITNTQNRIKALKKICKGIDDCSYAYKIRGTNEERNDGCLEKKPIIKMEDNITVSAEFPTVRKDVAPSAKFDMPQEMVYKILRHIDPSDYHILGCSETLCKPHWLLITNLPVPPPCLRPSNPSNAAARGEDDLTYKLSEILKFSNYIKHLQENGDPKAELVGCITALQMHVATYLDNASVPQQVTSQRGGRITKALKQRLEKKDGRVRGNLMGKRVDFTARTVITPDPNIEIDVIGIPGEVAKHLTFPEPVNQANYKVLTESVRAGPNGFNGANYIIDEDGEKTDLRFIEDRSTIQLKYGQKVERHVKDNDYVIVNRQPSLHKFSIMGHRVKVMKHSTFRLNLSVTTPYNAGYICDEMNILVPQTYAAMAEIKELMSVQKCMLTPQSNKPVMGLVQDSLLMIRILTQRDIFLNRDQVMQIVGFTSTFNMKLPMPAVLRPEPLWTGKQIFSTIIPPKLNHNGFSSFHPDYEDLKPGDIALQMKAEWKSCAEFYLKKSQPEVLKEIANVDLNHDLMKFGLDDKFLKKWLKRINTKFKRTATIDDIKRLGTISSLQKKKFMFYPDLTDSDTRVLIEKGEILSGYMCKKHLGNVASSLIHIITLDYGSDRIANFINDAQKVAHSFNNFHTCSFGFKDMRVHPKTKQKVAKIMKKANDVMDEWKRSGMPKKEFENKSNKMLNDARKKANEDSFATLNNDNAIKLMITAGSKGNIVNIPQMIRCVGQQNVEGQRIPFGFTNRTTPHFKQFDVSPKAKGFIENNLVNGLTPLEAFFQSMAAREGIIDTSVKTSEIGYLSRRLGKTMEDLILCYDGTVRNSAGEVVQWVYGEDGMDGSRLEFQKFEIVPDMIMKGFKEKYVWNEEVFVQDETGFLLKELNRLKKDLELVSEKKKIRVTSPVNFKRLLDHLPEPDTTTPFVEPARAAISIYKLQKRLWKYLPEAAEKWENHTALLIRSILASKKIVNEYKMRRNQFKWILTEIEKKFRMALASPGDSVGTLAGQSIGEPATQMTLNTFHYSGISEKNVTLGVPRLKEIVNTAKKIKTPSLCVKPKPAIAKNREAVEELAKRLECLYLADLVLGDKPDIWHDPDLTTTVIPEDIDLVARFQMMPDDPYDDDTELSPIVLRFTMNAEKMRDYKIRMDDIVDLLQQEYGSLLKLQWNDEYCDPCVLRVRPVVDKGTLPGEDSALLEELGHLMMRDIKVSGVDRIKKTFIVEDPELPGSFMIETDGVNLMEVMGFPEGKLSHPV